MMAQIRAFAKSPIAQVLMTILLISFVIFGIRGVTTSVGSRDEIVKAGGRPAISSAGFRQRWDNAKQGLEQQNGRPISNQEALASNFDRALADELANDEAAKEMLAREGVRPADELVVGEIRKVPAFFNPVTGAFDKAAYQRVLGGMGMSEADADRYFRDAIAEQHFGLGMASAVRAPFVYSVLQAAFLREGRDVTFFTVDPKTLGPPPKPTDAELEAYVKENAQRFTKPETRVLSYVRVNAADLLAKTEVPDAEVQKKFAFEKDSLSTPETRSFQEITVRDAGQGAALVAKIRGGADAAAAARSLGLNAVAFTDQPRSAVPDRAVADAVFSLAPGTTAGPVKGDLGLAVVHLVSVKPGRPASLETARPKIEADLKKSLATERAYQLTQKYEDLKGQGQDMAAAAKALGLAAVTTDPLTNRGATLLGQPAGIPPKVLASAFALPQGQQTDPINAGDGDYWIVRADRVLPPALVRLDEARPVIVQNFVVRRTADKLKAKADALAAQIRKDGSMDAAAKSVGAAAQSQKGVLRNAQSPALSPDVLGRLFEAKPGEVVVAPGNRLEFIVARLDRINPADAAALAPMAIAFRSQTSKRLAMDLLDEYRAAARQAVKPKIDYARARQAVGGAQGPAAP